MRGNVPLIIVGGFTKFDTISIIAPAGIILRSRTKYAEAMHVSHTLAIFPDIRRLSVGYVVNREGTF